MCRVPVTLRFRELRYRSVVSMAFSCKALVVLLSQSFTFIPSPSSVLLDAPLSLYLPPPGYPPSPLSLLPGTSPPKPPQPLIYRTSSLQHSIHSLPNAGPQGLPSKRRPPRSRMAAPSPAPPGPSTQNEDLASSSFPASFLPFPFCRSRPCSTHPLTCFTVSASSASPPSPMAVI